MGDHSSTDARPVIERTGQSSIHDGGEASTLVWTYSPSPGGRAAYVAPPDGCADVVVAARSGRVSVHLIGATARASSKPTDDVVFTCVARLRMGAASMLVGEPARSLRARALPIDEPWGRRALDEVLTARSPGDAARALARAVDARMRGRSRAHADPRSIDRIARGVTAAEEGSTLRLVARHVGVSERTLRRVIDDAIGLSPRALRALPRFCRALELLARATPPQNGAAIAAAAGYADQAHLIRDFRARIGETPDALRREWAVRGVVFRPRRAG